eukprot:gene1423-12043_t
MEPPWKKLKQTNGIVNNDLASSIQEQQKNMQELIQKFRQQQKETKNQTIPKITEFDFSNLNEIEKQIKLYTTDKIFSDSLNHWQFFYNLVLVDHVLSGKFNEKTFSVKFDEDDETVVETTCNYCKNNILWCEHISGLLLSYSRSPDEVLCYENLKEKMNNSSKNLLIRGILNISKNKPELLHEIQREIKNLEDTFVEDEEEDIQQYTQMEIEKKKEFENEALELLPIVESGPQIPVNLNSISNKVEDLIKNYIQGYQYDSDSDSGCGFENGDCDCDCHNYYRGYTSECEDCASNAICIPQSFSNIASNISEFVTMSEKFKSGGKNDIALYLIMKVAIPYIIASNESDTNIFARSGDNFEYYTFFTQLCDIIEGYAHDNSISDDQKEEVGSMLMDGYELIKNRMDFQNKKSRLSELIAAYSLKWNDPKLELILNGDEESIKDFKEDEFIIESRINHLLENNRKIECMHYCKAVKKYETHCKLLVELGKLNEAMNFAKEYYTKSEEFKKLSSILFDTKDFEDHKQLNELFRIAMKKMIEDYDKSGLIVRDAPFFKKYLENSIKAEKLDDLLESTPTIYFYDVPTMKEYIQILFTNGKADCERKFYIKYMKGNPSNFEVSFLRKVVLLSTTDEEKSEILDLLIEKPSIYKSWMVLSIVDELNAKTEILNPFVDALMEITLIESTSNTTDSIEKITYEWCFDKLKSNPEELIKKIKKDYKVEEFDDSLFSNENYMDQFYIFKSIQHFDSKLIEDLIIRLFDYFSRKFYPNKSWFKISSPTLNSYHNRTVQIIMEHFLDDPLVLTLKDPIEGDHYLISSLRNNPSLDVKILSQTQHKYRAPSRLFAGVKKKFSKPIRESLSKFHDKIEIMENWILQNVKLEKTIESLKNNKNPIVQMKLIGHLLDMKEYDLCNDLLKEYKPKFELVFSNLQKNEVFKDDLSLLQRKFSLLLRRSLFSGTPDLKILFEEFEREVSLQTFIDLREMVSDTTLRDRLTTKMLNHVWSFYNKDGIISDGNNPLSTLTQHIPMFAIGEQPLRVNLLSWILSKDASKDDSTFTLFLNEIKLFLKYKFDYSPFVENWKAMFSFILGRNPFMDTTTSIIELIFKDLSTDLGFFFAMKKNEAIKRKVMTPTYEKAIIWLRISVKIYKQMGKKKEWENFMTSMIRELKSKKAFVIALQTDFTFKYSNATPLFSKPEVIEIFCTSIKRNYSKKIVFSGIQPTGNLHLGNYLGAIKNWVALQNNEEYSEKIFCIVDLHATTMPHNPIKLRQDSLELTATLLACGLDPKKCYLYKQSQISGHSELTWILSCITPKNWLNHMIQFKEKSKKSSGGSLGLYNYPVLMASDILLYSNENEIDIPVGEDQTQHLELTRDISKRFNDLLKKDFFKVPNAVFTKTGTRIMNIRDGKSKMSKSDEHDFSRINLTDTEEEIEKKIMKSKTDSIDGISFDLENRPGVSNLINIYSSLINVSPNEICEKFKDKNLPYFKKELIDILIKNITPIRKEIEILKKDEKSIQNVLDIGSISANKIASKTLMNVKKEFGYL